MNETKIKRTGPQTKEDKCGKGKQTYQNKNHKPIMTKRQEGSLNYEGVAHSGIYS